MEAELKSVAQMLDLDGRVAIVTGAGQGLGFEIAKRLAEVGAAVLVNDYDESRAASAAERLDKAASVGGDVSKRADVEQMLAAALDAFGRVDILVNNAGIYPQVPFAEMTEDVWNRVMEVNALGTMLTCQVVSAEMIRRGEGGNIVNVLSGAAIRPLNTGLTAYATAKAGLRMFTQLLAKELAPHEIRVNSLLPGSMLTPGAEEVATRVAPTAIPMGRRAHPDEIARGVLFFVSGLADYVTGAELRIDGGRFTNV